MIALINNSIIMWSLLIIFFLINLSKGGIYLCPFDGCAAHCHDFGKQAAGCYLNDTVKTFLCYCLPKKIFSTIHIDKSTDCYKYINQDNCIKYKAGYDLRCITKNYHCRDTLKSISEPCRHRTCVNESIGICCSGAGIPVCYCEEDYAHCNCELNDNEYHKQIMSGIYYLNKIVYA